MYINNHHHYRSLAKISICVNCYQLCRITFTVVSDPENDEMDCEELGYAQVDLNKVRIHMCMRSKLSGHTTTWFKQ